LHLAVLVLELRRDTARGTEVINGLLAKFHELCRLNATAIPTLGFTPLRLAVYLADVYAIVVLLDEEDVDLSLTDEEGRTPMDLALFRLFETTGEETMGHIMAWLPHGARENAAEMQRNTSVGMRQNNSVRLLSQLIRSHLQTKNTPASSSRNQSSLHQIDDAMALLQIRKPTQEAGEAR
jgi:hypothetical protein